MHITSPSFAFLALTLTLTQSAIADISDYGKWWKDISDTDLKKIVIDHDPPTYLTNRYTIWSTNFQSFSTRNTTGLTTETMQYAIVKNSGTLTPNVNYVSAYIYMTPLNRTLSVEGATFSYFQCTGDGSEEFGKIEESQCEKQNKIGTWVVRKDEELGSVDVTELVFGGKMTVEERVEKVFTFQTGKNPSDQTTVVQGVPVIVAFFDKERVPAPTVRWIAPMPMDI